MRSKERAVASMKPALGSRTYPPAVTVIVSLKWPEVVRGSFWLAGLSL
jgi:hypothetical protein